MCLIFALIFLSTSIEAQTKTDAQKDLTFYVHQMVDTLSIWEYGDFLTDKQQKDLADNLRDFYATRDYKAAWINEEKEVLSNLGCNILDKLEQCREEGLTPNSYKVASMKTLQDSTFGLKMKHKPAAKYDVQLTQAYLTYLSHLSIGRFQPEKIDTAFVFEPRKKDLVKLVQQTVNDEDVSKVVNNLSPKVPDYIHLKRALYYYGKIQNDSNLVEIPSNLVLKQGEKHESVPTLAAYLMASGDLEDYDFPIIQRMKEVQKESKKVIKTVKDSTSNSKTTLASKSSEKNKREENKDDKMAGNTSTSNTATTSKSSEKNNGKENDEASKKQEKQIAVSSANVYTKEMSAALKNFQERNDLTSDGILGPNTLEVLQGSIEERIRQIQINMERMRWLPDELGEKYVWVNIPAFRLDVMQKGESSLNMKVVVGELYNPTPAFKDQIDHIVFSPTWTPTPGIATNDLLPKIKKNPNYFEEKNMVVYEDWSANAQKLNPKKIKWKEIEADNFPFKLVQQPGEDNSLGKVKFMFPNDMDIYLHDTPAKSLFNKEERDASHGCVRVADPVALGVKLLEDTEGDWTAKKVEEYMNKTEPTVQNIEGDVPVFLVYFTVWADKNGCLKFEEDVYNFDENQLALIEK